jgi:hypothetical protein
MRRAQHVAHPAAARQSALQALLEAVREEYKGEWRALIQGVSAAEDAGAALDVIEGWLGGHNLMDDEGVAIAAALVVGIRDFPKSPTLAKLCMVAALRPQVSGEGPQPVKIDLHYLIGEGMAGVRYPADLDAYEDAVIADATRRIKATFTEFRRRAAKAGIEATPVPVHYGRDLAWAAAHLVENMSYEALAERFDMDESVVKRAVGAILQRCGLRPRRRGKPRKAPSLVVRKGAKSRI